MTWRQRSGALLAGIAQQLLDLGTAFDGYGVDEGLPDPVVTALLGKFRAAKGNVADHAFSVDNQSDIRRCRYQLSGDFGIQITERSLRGPEHVPCFSSEHCGGPCQALVSRLQRTLSRNTFAPSKLETLRTARRPS